ncbi:MAG: UDP-N-acetylmuramoyl-L-alanine--D-glutamate ligase [Alphaproteobacteria bacterium]|nr:UDP-N-acetylmuramoyl-L-alanine--D-glutamate ligase [Alphaproteobacteria bacterium]
MSFAPDIFAGQRFAVVGLGRNGLPVARALVAMGAAVTAWDDTAGARAQATGLTVAEPALAGLDALVLSPGIPHTLPRPHPLAAAARAADVPILSDAELLFRAVRASGSRARFAGITGTNGKSTTTALLAHIVATAGVPVAAGGNLGTPALALPRLPDDGVYVLEMSSYMLERLATLRFDAAAMLNLTPDHLDRHGDMAGYAAAKRAIFARQDAGCTAALGIEDAPSRAMADGLAARVVRIAADMPADVYAPDGVLRDAGGPICDLREAAALPGAHNAQNAAAAAAMATALGIPRAAIARGVLSYPGLPHRQERVGERGGVLFVNDSKATNADSTARALACYPRVVLIAGGIAKAGGIESLAPFFPRIARAFLIGRDAPVLAATLAAHGVPHAVVETLERAVPAAWQAARTQAPVVLLSPACASFDQFSGFDARGERFRALVQTLAEAA